MSDRRSPAFRVEDAFVSPPELNAVIWRYMKLERFAWMLEKRGLYFSSVERFEDPHEGALTEIEDQQFSATSDETVRSAARYHTVTFSRWRVMANCWHLNPHESAAMCGVGVVRYVGDPTYVVQLRAGDRVSRRFLDA
jgi:hypothetical protein